MFIRNRLAVAVATAACTFPVLTMAAEVTAKSNMQIYGRAHLSVDSLDNGADYNEINFSSNSSRLGFKGKSDYGALTGFFQIEQEINFSESGGDFATRDTFAGVRGDFGMVRMGKFDTPFKAARGPANLFGDQVGDMRNLTRVGNARFDERMPNVIHYQSPKFNDLQVNVAYSLHEGDVANEGGDDKAFSTSLNYTAGILDLSLAYERYQEAYSRGERDAIRLAAAFKVMDNLKLVGFYQSADHDDDAHDSKVYGIGGETALVPKKTYLRAHYFMRDADAQNSDSDMLAVGIEQRIDSTLRFYINYAQVDNDDNARLTPWSQARSATPDGALGKMASGVSVGMRYDF